MAPIWSEIRFSLFQQDGHWGVYSFTLYTYWKKFAPVWLLSILPGLGLVLSGFPLTLLKSTEFVICVYACSCPLRLRLCPVCHILSFCYKFITIIEVVVPTFSRLGRNSFIAVPMITVFRWLWKPYVNASSPEHLVAALIVASIPPIGDTKYFIMYGYNSCSCFSVYYTFAFVWKRFRLEFPR